MNMPCRVSQDLNVHFNQLEEADRENELSQEEDQEKLNERLNRLYSSPDYVWESLGVDGIQYPDSIKNIADFAERKIAESNFDNDVAMQLSYGLREKDYYLIGMILGEFANEYLRNIAKV